MKILNFFWVFIAAFILVSCGTDGSDEENPQSLPTINIANAVVNEGNSGTTDASFILSLSAVSTSDVSVNYATSNGSAIAGSDYLATNGSATIMAGNSSTTVVVSVNGDTSQEDNETFTLTLSNPSPAATLGTSTATGTINNDDGVPALPNLSMSNVIVIEGNSGENNLEFILSLDASNGSDISVDYATSNASATAGSDYAATSGTVTITAGNTSTTLLLSITGDTSVESDETFALTLSNVTGANIIIANAIITIVNDDASPLGGPFMTYADNLNSLYAVDVSDPGNTYLVASGLTGNPDVGIEYSQMIITGDLNIGTATMNNFRPDSFVYFDAGKFWRVDLSAGSNLTPTQISNVDSGSGYVCYMDVVENTITPADSYIVFVRGVDQLTCLTNGGQAYAIQVKDNSSVAPTSISGGPYWGYVGIETMETSATPGEVTGFLVRNTNDYSLTRFDAGFTNPVLVQAGTSAIATFVDPVGQPPEGISFFLVDNILYSYTHSLSSTSVTTMRTFPGGSGYDGLIGEDFACNLTHCYFVEADNTSGVQSLYMAAIDGSGSTQIGTAFITEFILGISISSGRLYINTTPNVGGAFGSGRSIYAVSVSGGSPEVVDNIATGYFSGMFSAGAYMYYNRVDTSVGTTVSASVLKDDNTVVISPIENASWVGLVFSSTQANEGFDPSEFILAEDVTGPVSIRYTTYNATAATIGVVVGTIDGSTVAAGTFAVGIGDTIFGVANFATGTGPQSDVIMANRTIGDSLQKVTDTASVSEQAIF